MARSILNVLGPRRGKGTTKREVKKSRPTSNDSDQKDTCDRGGKAETSLGASSASGASGAPPDPTARKSKRFYLCCWRIQQSPSPSPCQYEREWREESLGSDLGNSGHCPSYPARGRKSRIPDWMVRHGAPRTEPTIALRNVKTVQKYSLAIPVTDNVLEVADNVLDILIWKADYGQIRRLLVLELRADVNVMDDEVFRSLNLEKEPCDMTTPLRLPGQADLKPLGKVHCRWCLWGDSHSYLTSFLIVRGCDFDVMIGRHSIAEHQIYP